MWTRWAVAAIVDFEIARPPSKESLVVRFINRASDALLSKLVPNAVAVADGPCQTEYGGGCWVRQCCDYGPGTYCYPWYNPCG